jgi:hypothetical protein
MCGGCARVCPAVRDLLRSCMTAASNHNGRWSSSASWCSPSACSPTATLCGRTPARWRPPPAAPAAAAAQQHRWSWVMTGRRPACARATPSTCGSSSCCCGSGAATTSTSTSTPWPAPWCTALQAACARMALARAPWVRRTGRLAPLWRRCLLASLLAVRLARMLREPGRWARRSGRTGGPWALPAGAVWAPPSSSRRRCWREARPAQRRLRARQHGTRQRRRRRQQRAASRHGSRGRSGA